jgi:uncharacterized protein (TIGR02246 family)
MRLEKLLPDGAVSSLREGSQAGGVARPVVRDTPGGVETWELIAREQIRDLVAAYAHNADSGRFDEMVALFADDGVLETPDGQEHRGRDVIRAFLTATKAQRAANVTGAALIRHHVSNLRIVVSGADAATGAAYFFVITERGPDHWGRYRDRYVCVDGQWRFAHRRVRLDGREQRAER